MIRTTKFDDPPVNTPLLLTVPGQYTWTPFSLTATLDTRSPTCLTGPAAAVSTPEADGTYEGCNIGGVTGLVPGDFAIDMSGGSGGALFRGWVQLTTAFSLPGQDNAWEFWYQAVPGVTLQSIYDLRDDTGVLFAVQGLGTRLEFVYREDDGIEIAVVGPVGSFPQDGAPHHVVVSLEQPTVTFYLDGDETFSQAGVVLDSAVVASRSALGAAFSLGSYVEHATVILDEMLVWGRPLSGTEVVDHYAAGLIDIDTWNDAIVASGFNLWWHLNEVGAPTADCDVTLELSDGTHVLADVTPVGTQPQNTIVTYHWIASTQALTPIGTGVDVAYVGIPQWTLPAGFTLAGLILGTPYYQWSDVFLFYDDGQPADSTPGIDGFRWVTITG